MAITGAKFLQLNRKNLSVSTHALERLREVTPNAFTYSQMLELFDLSIHLKLDQITSLGYHPDYTRRNGKGRETHFFLLPKIKIGGEAIAVIMNGESIEDEDKLVWVTTYHPDRQTMLYRLTPVESVMARL